MLFIAEFLVHHSSNTLMSRQNGPHFADAILKCISLNENAWISLNISLAFVPKVRVNNTSALVQIIAWGRLCDKPLSEPMLVSLLMHAPPYLTELTHWIHNKMAALLYGAILKLVYYDAMFSRLIKYSLKPISSCPINNKTALFYIMAWHIPGGKPLSEPVMG